MSHTAVISLSLVLLAACGGESVAEVQPEAVEPETIEAPAPEPALPTVLRIANAPARVAVGDTLALQAVASVGDTSVEAGSVEWSTSDAEVLAISADGSATAVGIGRVWVKASNEGGSTAMVEIDVQ